MDWDTYFMGLAVFVSLKSKDESTKCGCILIGDKNQIVSTGYNGIPRGLEDDNPNRHERPEKYYWFEHAERNAIYNAALNGMCTKGTRAFITAPPCADCTRALVQSGIKEISLPSYHNLRDKQGSKKWQEHLRVSQRILQEADIHVEYIDSLMIMKASAELVKAVSPFEPKFKKEDVVRVTGLMHQDPDSTYRITELINPSYLDDFANVKTHPRTSLCVVGQVYCVINTVSDGFYHYVLEDDMTLVEGESSDGDS